jgi:hypothetical protein
MPKSSQERRSPSTVRIFLSAKEIEDLVELAQYYQRSMGFMRHVVRITSPRPIRHRFDFVAEESRLLRAFAESVRSGDGAGRDVEFTARSLVAFWGRALSSLHSKRSRRRLSAERLAVREALADKLRRATEKLWLKDAAGVSGEMATRRAPEVSWMREELEGPSG